MPFDAAPAAGFSWQSLFLPAGTKVWFRCAGVEHEAVVSGSAMDWSGRFVSPTEFANGVAGHARNAWRDLWLLRPGLDADYRLADDLRAAAAGEIRPLRSRPAARGAARPKAGAVLSLVPFLIRAGGVRDPGGDVKAILGGTTRTRPGLISGRGLPLDRAASLALESGYFPEHSVARSGAESESLVGCLASAGRDAETITERDLLDAIDLELRGTFRWPDGFVPESEIDPVREELDRSAGESDDAARWRELVALARSAGSAAVLEFLAVADVLPASGPVVFVPGDDCPF